MSRFAQTLPLNVLRLSRLQGRLPPAGLERTAGDGRAVFIGLSRFGQSVSV